MKHFQLFGETITKQQFRQFCQVDSRNAATRLLRGFERTGDTRAAVYELPEQIIIRHQDLLFNSRNPPGLQERKKADVHAHPPLPC